MRKITRDRELTSSLIEEIKALNVDGLPKREIMNKTGCSMGLVTNVIDRAMKNEEYSELVENGRIARINSVIELQSKQVDIPKKKKRESLTDEQKIELVLEYQTEKFTQAALAEKYNIDKSTVSRLVRELMGEDDVQKIKDKQRKIKQTSIELFVSTEAEANAMNRVSFPLSVGLISKRHPMPVNSFIFDRIPESKINDFQWQEAIVEDFIKENVIGKHNGLIVYLSGLQSALATLIKVCTDYRINLWLAHHRVGSCYDIQEQLNFDSDVQIFKRIFHQIIKCDEVYTFNCSLMELNDTQEHYELEIIDNDADSKIINKCVIFCKSLKDASTILNFVSFGVFEKKKHIKRNIYMRRNNLTNDGDRFIGKTKISTRVEN